jgi:hypothetical protein
LRVCAEGLKRKKQAHILIRMSLFKKRIASETEQSYCNNYFSKHGRGVVPLDNALVGWNPDFDADVCS